MRRELLPAYAMGLVILSVALGFAGVSLGTLLILPLVLGCPLMMIFMMRGMDRGRGTADDPEQPAAKPSDLHDHQPSAGR